MAISNPVIRSIALTTDSSNDCLNKANQLLSRTSVDSMFVTVLYGIFNLETGEIDFTNAGHNPTYILRKDGEVEKVPQHSNFVLGAFEDFIFQPDTTHLDHGDSFELCKSCVDMGFSSVMIDGSSLPYEDNIALTKKVVEYAHKYDVTVEAELGVLAGVEDEVAAEESHYTKPEEVIDFATRTGCDSLAISIGTSHGAYKFKPEQCTRDPKTGRLVPPPLAFDVLHEIEKKLPGFPIVLHGSSSVPQEYVDIINANGGKLPDAVGIPEEQLREASKSAVCKINIDSDSRLAMTAAIRKVFNEKPGEFDPRKYLGPARDEMKKLYEHKIVDVLGSNGKAE